MINYYWKEFNWYLWLRFFKWKRKIAHEYQNKKKEKLIAQEIELELSWRRVKCAIKSSKIPTSYKSSAL